MMDLTPLDVRKKKDDLRRAVRGYEPTQVDAFLELVADRLEAMVQQEIRLNEQAGLLRERLASFEERERALNEALIAAQELREEARLQSEKQANLRLQEAEQESQRVVLESRRAAEDSERALEELHARRASFLRGMRSLLQRFLAEVDYEEEKLSRSPGTGASVAEESSPPSPPDASSEPPAHQPEASEDETSFA